MLIDIKHWDMHDPQRCTCDWMLRCEWCKALCLCGHPRTDHRHTGTGWCTVCKQSLAVSINRCKEFLSADWNP